MKVVHVCTAPIGAAYRLHTGLRALGVESRLFSIDAPAQPDPDVTVFHPPRGLPARLRRWLARERIEREFARYRATRPRGSGRFYDDRSPHGGDALRQLPACDVVHLHAMAHFIDFGAFFEMLPRTLPIVRTLHDMNFFTGGCHQDWGCGRFRQQCGACPQLGSQGEHDLSRRIWQRKRRALAALAPERLHVVTPSRWMAGMATASSLLRDTPVTAIPLGIDVEKFRPRDRRFVRDLWGIPDDARVMLFVSSPLDRPEKGFGLLAAALRGSPQPSHTVLLSVGGGEPPENPGVPHRRLGHVGHETVMSTVYSAADVLVVPSVQDTFPQACIEALACGLPVVGFDVGGISEVVRPGITGVLVPPRDTAALRDAVGTLLSDPPRRAQFGANGRRIVLEEYTLELQASRHKALYERILLHAARPPEAAGRSRAGRSARDAAAVG